MFARYMRLLLVITATAVLLSCGSGGGRGQDGPSGTGRVYISIGSGIKAARTAGSAATSSLPPDITDITVTCTAAGISPVTGSLPLDGSSLALEVPAGANRVFTVDAYAGSILRMTGSATVSYIYAGAQTTVAITLTDVATLTLTPATVSVETNTTQQFTSTVTGHADTTVTWSVNGVDGGNATSGTVSTSGFYTAPAYVPTPATVTVRATSSADTTLVGTASVTVSASTVPVAVSVSPSTVSLGALQVQTFSAVVTGTTNSAVTWSVEDVSCGTDMGSINGSGVYTAGNPATTCQATVRATSDADPTKSDTATITVVVINVTVSPSTATVLTGGTRQFNVTVTGNSNTNVTWHVNDIDGGNSTVGTIDGTGLYTAPASVPGPATVTVKAVSDADGVSFGTAQATVEISTCLGGSITVDSTLDAVDSSIGDGFCDDGAGNCTLRAAIQEANFCNGADIINIPAGTYTLTIAGTGEEAAATGDLDITDDLTITGAGAAGTIIDGGVLDRVFDVSPVADVSAIFNDMTIQNGNTLLNGGGIHRANSCSITVNNAIIRNNTATAGGGVASEGGYISGNPYSTEINDTAILNNTSNGNGGGIYSSSGPLIINRSDIAGNSTTGSWHSGGGLQFSGTTMTITDSTIRNNRAVYAGGGLYTDSQGNAVVINSTISSNSAGQFGGGIYHINGSITLKLINSTVTDNTAGLGGGIRTNRSVILQNTIMAASNGGGQPGGDCVIDTGGSIDSTLNNLDGDGSCGAGITADPLLGALADNGGATQTHALLSGSPAIDAGDNTSCPATDQRGVDRSDGSCDIGAYEYP